jgi:hypothetical protein
MIWFLVACGAIVAGGWLVSRVTGARSHYLDQWKLEDGESILWRDDAADVYLIPRLGQARKMSFARLRRQTVMVTNRRIVVAARPLFGQRRIVQHVLVAAGDANSERLDGGLFSAGYQTLVIGPGIGRHLEDAKPHLDLVPASGHPSSTNLATIRVFTDQGAGFPDQLDKSAVRA